MGNARFRSPRDQGTMFSIVATFVATCVVAGIAGASGSTSVAGATTSDPGLALQKDLVNVIRNARPSVVEISTDTGLGSGVVFDGKGDIVTNAHVVGNATAFTVTFSNGKVLTAHLMGTYAPDDLAVIRVSPSKGLRPASFGNSAALEVGDIVLAMGSPLGLSSSVTDGIVSFNGRSVSEGNGVVLQDLIQTSAAINPGNSGGALVNLANKVIGIPTLSASDGSSAAPGLGFAIPANTVKLIAPQLIAKGRVTTAGRAGLGLTGADSTAYDGSPLGVQVTSVQANGPAAKAGIVPGELIVALNGRPTANYTALLTLLTLYRPGNRVNISLQSLSGIKRTVTVTLADLAQF